MPKPKSTGPEPDEYVLGPAFDLKPDPIPEDRHLPDARQIVHDAVWHMYTEMMSSDVPSAVRARLAETLANHAEHWLNAAGEGDTADVLKLIQSATRKSAKG